MKIQKLPFLKYQVSCQFLSIEMTPTPDLNHCDDAAVFIQM